MEEVLVRPAGCKMVCGERTGTIWLPSHKPGGCCTLVVVENIPPHNVKP